MKKGKVWLVGAGPYDEGLFTLKGQEVLKKADVVVYDHLVGPGILQMIPKEAERIDVGKEAGNHKVNQEDINLILLEEAEKGKYVVRLKGGDPFLFGRGGEELELLTKNHIPYEIVPGITSAIAVPAYAGIPVTHRDYTSSLHIITGHKKQGNPEPIDYKSLVALGDGTFVFLMSIGELDNICTGLIKAGMDKHMPAAVLEKGTSSKQRRIVATLESLPDNAKEMNMGTPGIIIVGKVCSLEEKFHWAEDRILGGARIYITRPKDKNSYIAERLYELGAEVIKLPAIQTSPISIHTEWERVEQHLEEYEWVVFTSSVGVDYFFKHLRNTRKDIRELSHLHFAAIGKVTKETIEDHGVLVDYIPCNFNGKELGIGLVERVTAGKKVLVFAPKDTSNDCVTELESKNIPCHVIEIYGTVYESNHCEKMQLEQKDMVVFTSASTVKGFVQAMAGVNLAGIKAICIGEQTSMEALKHNMHVVVSQEATMDSLVNKVVEEYLKSKDGQ